MSHLSAIASVFPVRWKETFARFSIVLCMIATTFPGPPALAQLPNLLSASPADKKQSQPEVKAASPEQLREATRRALAEAQMERDRTIVTPPAGITRPDVEERSRLLYVLVIRLNSQLSLIDELEELRRARTDAEQNSKNWTGFPEPPPYSILLVDEVREQVTAAHAKVSGLETSWQLFARQVAQYRELAKNAEKKERQAADDLERARSPEDRATAKWRKELAELRARNADAMAAWIALRYEVLGERLGVARVELDLQERQLATARKRMVFSRADLNKALARLMSSRSSLEKEQESSLANDVRSMQRLVQAQQELAAFTVRHGKGESAAATEAERDELEARLRAAQAWVESSRLETETVSALLFMNQSTADFWEQRYSALAGTDAEKQRDALAGFRKSREQLKPWLDYVEHRVEVYQEAEREQEARLVGIDERSPLGAAERDLLAARRSQRELAERLKVTLGKAYIQLQSWQEDVERVRQEYTFNQRLHDTLARVASVARTVWQFELFSVEDTVEVAGQKVVTSRGVTVGKSIGAIVLFLVGYLLAAFWGRRVQRIMVARFGVGVYLADVIRRWLLALTTFILLIITLNLARIPLAVFAFLGGALAIGIGFGTQTLIKNLISGMLILLERKFKVGDTVDVDGVVGRITTVDIRSSTVLGFDGVETVIPNSTFLENKVTNWTYTDAKVRRILRVGVVYGSPTARVRDILVECAERNGLVLRDPPPQVFFEDFGDNSLIFALYFWIDYGSKTNPLQVASDLRFMIEKSFAEENIVVAFPQRDVHLDSVQPLRVEVVSPEH